MTYAETINCVPELRQTYYNNKPNDADDQVVSWKKNRLEELKNKTSKALGSWENNLVGRVVASTPENKFVVPDATERTEIAKQARTVKLALKISIIVAEILICVALMAACVILLPPSLTFLPLGPIFVLGTCPVACTFQMFNENTIPFSNYFECVRKDRCLGKDFKYFVAQHFNGVELTREQLLDVKLHDIYSEWEAELYAITQYAITHY